MIELLYERVEYHKDKIIAPILLAEMRAMEVKKNGKVEHSSTTHDDQVFSWLMALYVWYDGENLAERYHIMKNTLKTDDEEELFDRDLDEQISPKEFINLEKFQDVDGENNEHREEILAAYDFIDNNKPIITTSEFKDKTELADIAQRNALIMSDKNAREAYCKAYGIDPSTFGDSVVNPTIQLPDSLFGISDNSDIDDNTPYIAMDFNNMGSNPNNEYHQPLMGNLSHFWNDV